MAARFPDLQLADSVVQRTIAQPSSLSDMINQVCECAKKLLESLPSLSNAFEDVQKFKEKLQSDLENNTATSDSKVTIMLADLQQEFRDFILVGKGFLHSCLWMAKFATMQGGSAYRNQAAIRS